MANEGTLTVTGEARYLIKIQKMLRSYKKVQVKMEGVENPLAAAKQQRAEEEKAAAKIKADEEKVKAEQLAQASMNSKDITTDSLTGMKTQTVGKVKAKK